MGTRISHRENDRSNVFAKLASNRYFYVALQFVRKLVGESHDHSVPLVIPTTVATITGKVVFPGMRACPKQGCCLESADGGLPRGVYKGRLSCLLFFSFLSL